MSPLQIEILLWYRARMVDYREGDFSAPAVRAAIDDFRDRSELLAKNPHAGEGGDFRTYRLTDRGDAFVDAILSLPLPVCRWEIPQQAAV